jgi:hypothetical protein
MRKLLRSRWTWLVVIALYAVTWVGGWISHARQLREETESSWKYLKARFGTETESLPLSRYVHKDGPRYYVSWCLPILPGLLLADSGESIGPLSGHGGLKLVLYYGVGSSELAMLCGWWA